MKGRFGERLREIRIEAKRTMKDAAEVLDVSVPYYSDVELGRRHPFRHDRIRDLCAFFGRPEAAEELALFAVQDRDGEVQLSAKDQGARKVLVALERRLDSGTLDRATIEELLKLLGKEGKR